jgi:hypothetical protein
MAERLARVTQVHAVPGPGRISVEKVAFFCNTVSGTRSQALQLRLWNS